MINLHVVEIVKWGNPRILNLVSGQQILLPDVDDNHQLFRAISSDWEYEKRIVRK